MGYTLVKSFERGIDTRKLIDTTEAGALLDARDCHITLGGELEKRAAFVVSDTLPPETIGLWVTEGRVIHTWGDVAEPTGMPAGSVYHNIADPAGGELEHILSVEEFNSSLYVVAQYGPSAEFPNGRVLHWWNDTLVVYPPLEPVDGGGDPPTTSPGNKPKATMYFQIMFFDPPPDVYITGVYLVTPASTYNWGVDAWPIVSTTGLTGTWPTSSAHVVSAPDSGNPAKIAAKCMNIVNAFVPPGVDPPPVVVKAQATEDTILFWIEDEGPTYNGWKVIIHTSGPCLPQPGGSQTFAGGTVGGGGGALLSAPVPFAGEPGDPIDKGTFALAHNYRMFSVQDTYLNFCSPKDPSIWEGLAKNAGFIDHSMLTNRKPKLMSMGDYGGDLAVFGKRHIFVWSIDVVPLGDKKRQTLHGTGTFAPHSVVPFGQSDVMYLDISGVRSLRARDSSEQAFSADIGNLIDDLVRAKIEASSEELKLYNFWGIVEPRSGRLWMALYDQIFVLSFYPSSRISAWTWYDATTAPVDMMCESDNSIYWRSGDNIVIYGGENGNEYDDTEAMARIPYIDAGKPATSKNWTGIDLALFGTWQVRASFDPTAPTAFDLLANLTKSTYAQQKIAINGESPALSLELTSTYVGPARIGNAALHYTESTAD